MAIQSELLLLPAIVSITAALAWIVFLFEKAGGSYAIIPPYAAAFVSIGLFTFSLYYIIQNITSEPPTKEWAAPFIWGWIVLYVSVLVSHISGRKK